MSDFIRSRLDLLDRLETLTEFARVLDVDVATLLDATTSGSAA